MDSKSNKDSQRLLWVFTFFDFLTMVLGQLNEVDGHSFKIKQLIIAGACYISLCVEVASIINIPEFLGAISAGFFSYPNIRIYMEAAVAVVISYVSLLVVNWSYIWLALFPAIAIVFIVALCKELTRKSRRSSQRQSHHACDAQGSQMPDEDITCSHTTTPSNVVVSEQVMSSSMPDQVGALGLFPFWVLRLMLYIHGDRLGVSRFLLFFSSMLGALMLMMTRLAATGAGLGVAPATVLLRRTLLIVLLVAVHSVTAELLGDKVALFCLPEIALVLLWFSVRLDQCSGGAGGSLFSRGPLRLDNVRARMQISFIFLGVLVIAAAHVLARPNAMDEFLFPWCTQAGACCGVSGLLCLCDVFMLHQWPGQDGNAVPFLQEAVKLLLWWAAALLIAATVFFGVTYLAAHHQLAGWILDGYGTNSWSS